MKKKTYYTLLSIPIIGIFVKVACDPMIGCSPALDEGLPRPVTDYMKTHPDVFITKRLLKSLMRNK